MPGKSELLQEIMIIDRTINELNKNHDFIKIKKYISRMENPIFGKRSIKILSPDDFQTELLIRKKTKKWKVIKNKYYNMRQKYEDKISSLYNRRNELENEIFSR